MARLDAVTVISRGYLPHVRVLCESLAAHEPRARLTAVIVDDTDPQNEPFTTLTPLELGIEERELHRRAMLFDAQGLISSIRPHAIAHLLRAGAESALLIDADMLVLAPIADLWKLAARRGVLLSPHAVRPLPGAPGEWPEEQFLRAGTFNGGLLGVGAGATAFLDWMAQRTARDCSRAFTRGLFYSQTWLNLVPALFGHAILTDPGVNVTAHRLAGEDFAGTDERSSIAGQRLRLFHFTGFDPAHPDLLSSYDTVGLGERPRLAALCRDYAARLIAHGWPERTAYGWGTLPGGLRVDEVMAGIYAGSLLAAERGLGEEPPDPFDHAHPGAFVDWLRDPPAELSRYLLAVHAAREDLRTAFPGVPGPSTADFARWASGKADQHAEPEIPRELASVRRSGAGPHDP